MERLEKRHHGHNAIIEMMKKLHARYEPAGENEKNVVTFRIEKGMSRQDITNNVLEKVNHLY